MVTELLPAALDGTTLDRIQAQHAEPEWLNRTINIDTGCVFGGRLTALRYPENELVSVPARAVYAEPAKPFLLEAEVPERLTSQQREDELPLGLQAR